VLVEGRQLSERISAARGGVKGGRGLEEKLKEAAGGGKCRAASGRTSKRDGAPLIRDFERHWQLQGREVCSEGSRKGGEPKEGGRLTAAEND